MKKVKKSVDKALDTIGEFVEDLTELKDLEVVTDGENVTIKNSYKIDSSIVRFGYSFYLNHINEDTKDIIKGSTAGVAFEYMVHNKAYKIGKVFKIESFVTSGKDLSVGRTIFVDGAGNMDNSRSRFSKIITGLYAGFAGPIFVAYDLYVQYGG